MNRKLARLKQLESRLTEKYEGNEQQYTFHAGFYLGYVKGRIREIEELIEDADYPMSCDLPYISIERRK